MGAIAGAEAARHAAGMSIYRLSATVVDQPCSLSSGDISLPISCVLNASIRPVTAALLVRVCVTETEAEEFRSAVKRLAAMYRKHIQIEDELIFPLASRHLSPEMKSAIGKEMADRRQLEPVIPRL